MSLRSFIGCKGDHAARGMLILAFVASAITGALAFAAVSLLPDWDDAGGRGLGDAFRALLVAVYLILSILLFGLALWRKTENTI